MSRWKRLTVNLSDDVAEAAKRRAREQRRSFAAYVAGLIEKDLHASGPLLDEETRREIERVVQEHVQAHYGSSSAGRSGRKS